MVPGKAYQLAMGLTAPWFIMYARMPVNKTITQSMNNTAQYDSAPLEKYQDANFDIDFTLKYFW